MDAGLSVGCDHGGTPVRSINHKVHNSYLHGLNKEI